jgi:fatty acyl-CoA reductase
MSASSNMIDSNSLRGAPRTILLTGASGFLGKVILYELMRRKEELNVANVVVVVRGKGTRTAEDRFRKDVVSSPAFASLLPGWDSIVRVLDGDLAHAAFGQSDAERELLKDITHVIHSAAAVSFTLPAPVAANANITTCVNLLAATKACTKLERIVYVSTAYTTPHHDGRIAEALVKLPKPANELYEMLMAGQQKDEELLAITGHPNTYTMTKTVAEHIVAERRGNVPVTIVRPSIISASLQHPMPAWIDSTAGFGAFAMLIGLGHLRAVIGQPQARLDLIPVDEVTRCVLDEMVQTQTELTVVHSVSGKHRAPTVHESWGEIQRHFAQNPVQRRPVRGYLGPAGSAFQLADIVHHRMPMAIASVGSPVRKRQAKKLASRIEYLNEVFPYFTTRTFDFDLSPRQKEPFIPGYNAREYVVTICRGVSRHLLDQRDDEWTLAGRNHIGHGGDMKWVYRQPEGNAFVRLGIWLTTKTLRRIADAVTVDIPSFERARDMRAEGTGIALLPSHRSFLDFVLCSYLAFARPDLGIRVPYVAAAVEFGRIPLLGYLLRSVHAFYVDRKASRENRDLPKRVKKMLDNGEVVEFFVEGARSRSREFLRPKRGLIRCLEQSGRPVMIMPIAISYDRVPEEAVFARELSGSPKAGLSLLPLFGWLADVWRGRVNIGRIHVACGAPLMIDASSDAQTVGDRVIEELRGAMAVTSFHIDAYAASLENGSNTEAEELDGDMIRERIEASGGRVLESRLPLPEDLPPVIALTMREHFAHFLTTEAKSSVEMAKRNEEKGVSDDWQERGLAGSGASTSRDIA